VPHASNVSLTSKNMDREVKSKQHVVQFFSVISDIFLLALRLSSKLKVPVRAVL
jgi:hypothetical protein